MELIYLILAIGIGCIVSDLTPGISGPGPVAFAAVLIVIHLARRFWQYLGQEDD